VHPHANLEVDRGEEHRACAGGETVGHRVLPGVEGRGGTHEKHLTLPETIVDLINPVVIFVT
jgi:hypothetical protein